MDGHGRRVLVADQEESVCCLIRAILERAGYIVHSATDGIEALSEMKRLPFNAIMADYAMPRLDGVRLLLLSRMMWPQIPVLLLSNECMELPGLVQKQGLCAFIQKPFDPQDLLRILEETLSWASEQAPAVPTAAEVSP